MVSGNMPDISFDGVDVVQGLQDISTYFNNLKNFLPSFARMGGILGHILRTFPNKFWFALTFLVICMTISRIVCRRGH